MYKLTESPYLVIRLADNAYISLPPRTPEAAEYIDWLAAGNTPEPVDEPLLSDIISEAIMGIDADTDTVYGAVLGNRGPEYLDAEVAAQAYKDAGYAGIVPEDVQSYATAMGWTAQQAADDILTTAAAWRPAKSTIRANRLAAKEAVRDCLASSEVEAVLAWWAVFVVAIRGQLGI